MAVPEETAAIAAQHYTSQVNLAASVSNAVQRIWRLVNPSNLTKSWAARSTEALAVLTAGQTAAAQRSDQYVSAIASSQGMRPTPAARIVPDQFAGVASDGRNLLDLLQEVPIVVKVSVSRGNTIDRAMISGQVWLDMAARTQVADAGRTADGVAIVTRKQLTGYIRMLNPPSCSRCVILAGRWYAWNDGFERHPRCDCRHIPVAEDDAGDLRTNPRAYFDSLDEAEQNRTFTVAGAQAIRDGADIAQVVNARRGMTKAGTTTESTTKRGVAKRGRLMPEAIYERAQGDREQAIRLLQRHGYLR